jgi:subtilisin family serine protease
MTMGTPLAIRVSAMEYDQSKSPQYSTLLTQNATSASPNESVLLSEDIEILNLIVPELNDGDINKELLHIELVSNDPAVLTGSLWGMLGNEGTIVNQYGSQSNEAWALGHVGSLKSVIGIIDTGIDYAHPDLYRNIWINQNEIPPFMRPLIVDIDGDKIVTFLDLNDIRNISYVSDINKNGFIDAGDLLTDTRWSNRTDDDNNRYIDDLIGWDFINNDNNPFDDNGHGTHVSGTIGAIGGNGAGVAGVNWNIQILPMKFLSATGAGSLSNAIRAIEYFTDLSIKNRPLENFLATNNSWGGGAYSSAMDAAISRAALNNILFVAAAGNSTQNNDLISSFPSSYSTLKTAGYDAVISVASINQYGDLSYFSNYGTKTVDLGAPGSSIYSTIPKNYYATYSGTSMAAPHVTGAIGLYASANVGVDAPSIVRALFASAYPTASLTGKTATGGRLDVGTLISPAVTTPNDTIAPTVWSFNPVDGLTGVAPTTNIVLGFSETITRGMGNILLRAGSSTGAIVESFDAATSARLSLSGSTLTIDPTNTLANNTKYFVTFGAGTIKDLAGNSYAGTTTYDFRTALQIITPTAKSIDLRSKSLQIDPTKSDDSFFIEFPIPFSITTLTPAQQIAATYHAFFNRQFDLAGFNFWIDEFTKGLKTQGAATLFANIASSFAVGDEAKQLYPFLANPKGASNDQIEAFLSKVYDNLFNRTPDADGLAYWRGEIQNTIKAGQFVGSVLVNIMSGTQNSTAGQDITTLMSKVAVSLEYVQQQQLYGTQWTAADDKAEAVALLDPVGDLPETLLIGMANAHNLVLADMVV